MSIKKINGFRIFLNQRLGKGSYGSVFKGQSVNKQICAVKIIDKTNIDSDPYLKNALISQIKIMKALKSDNIVGFVDVMESNNNYYIIQELCTGDLEGYLKGKPGKCVDEKQGIKLLTEICNGFVTLVQQGIVHRDLKPANLLMAKGKIKIGDFGFAKKNVTQKLKNQTSVGTPLYMPVQLLKGEPYTSKCDIWAIGFIFYEMLHGCTPWTARSQFELVNNILNKPLKFSPNLSPVTVKFIEKTLQAEEQKRMSWDQLFRHEIFEGFFKKYTEDSEKLENVYKKVMGDLRFRVNSQNIHLKNLWESLGYSEDKELNRGEFGQFLRLIHPTMASIQQQYFYEKMDENGDGSISLKEVSNEFEKYSIPLASVFGNKLPFMLKKLVSIEEDPEDLMNMQQGNKINPELQKKIQNCFNRLHTILSKKNLTLYKVYSAYDGDKNGQLSLPEFSKIIKRLDPSFSEDELQAIFDLVDADSSKTIQFDQLNSYYCKIIGMPEALYVSPEEQAEKLQKKTNYYQQKKQSEKQ